MVNGEVDEKKIDELIQKWIEFAERHKIEKLKLNQDTEKVRALAKGVLHNQEKYGLKFCPCRISSKDREKDLKLICPCNFKIQKSWQERGECWCGLFFKA